MYEYEYNLLKHVLLHHRSIWNNLLTPYRTRLYAHLRSYNNFMYWVTYVTVALLRLGSYKIKSGYWVIKAIFSICHSLGHMPCFPAVALCRCRISFPSKGATSWLRLPPLLSMWWGAIAVLMPEKQPKTTQKRTEELSIVSFFFCKRTRTTQQATDVMRQWCTSLVYSEYAD